MTSSTDDTHCLWQGLLENDHHDTSSNGATSTAVLVKDDSDEEHATASSDRNCYGRSAAYLTQCPGKVWVSVVVGKRHSFLSSCFCVCFTMSRAP